MNDIAFFDIEVGVNNAKIFDLGLVLNDNKITTTSVTDIVNVFKSHKVKFICGHNFIDHDRKFLATTSFNPFLEKVDIIDTLHLSMLLFTNKKTHKLDKPYKSEVNIENQPLGDAEQTKELFRFLDIKFDSLDNNLQKIFYQLLSSNMYYKAYFEFKNLVNEEINIYSIIKDKICCSVDDINKIVKNNPVELAYIISYLFSDSKAAISKVILIRYPQIVDILKHILFNFEKLNLEEFAHNEFDIPSFKTFEKDNKNLLDFNDISQKDIALSALKDESLLVILPTGGGKTFTFQLPALVKAKAYKGLTVVISPLQALMKNHVDSFSDKNNNFKVVAISGYLSPIERMNVITEIENGIVDILYLAPEALRSNTVFKALQSRIIERFVIDEAHCFSSWGHDFRHDYYFVAPTIKELQDKSEFQNNIPVSCFTATAKPEVLEDIKNYLSTNLNLSTQDFIASSKRKNLEYKAIEIETKEDKYEVLIKELLRVGKKPTIIYIPQNARECQKLSETLSDDERLRHLNLVIEPFYSKIDEHIETGKRTGRNKSQILNDYISNEIDIVIATTAFGMGIDKPDIEVVIHYEQSDSLESYLQESGRGARSDKLTAECIVLFCRDDFNKTFSQLNNSKLDYHEIDRIVRVLKRAERKEVYLSPKQVAEGMGIDTEDSKVDYETMIKTALLELEQAGVIKRGRNSYKIFATSVDKEKRSMEYVHEVLDSKTEYEDLYQYMILVMQNIIQRSKVDAVEVEDLAENVGINKKLIFEVLYALQKEKLLEFDNDISLFVQKNVQKEFDDYFKLEQQILEYFINLPHFTTSINLKELNSSIDDKNKIKTIKKIIQSWGHLSKLKANIFNTWFKKDLCTFELIEEKKIVLKKLVEIRSKTCQFIIDKTLDALQEKDKEEIELSTNKLKVEYDDIQKLSLDGFHHSIVYLNSLLKNFQLRRGRLIYFQTFNIKKEKLLETRIPYQKGIHFNKSLKPYYERKVESIHIQMAFLDKLVNDGWDKSSVFVQDYFSMDYKQFKKKYNFDEKLIKLAVTKDRLEKIIEDLNDEQKEIFDNHDSDSIMILAGPGSGKTKTLVHKIASLITLENHKPDYFLMLAHSRVAVAEFKNRLFKLIGNQAYEMKIFTFHAFAISLLGKNIKEDSSALKNVISLATEKLRDREIELPFIQMLVLDEYQDVGSQTYSFIKEIYQHMSKDKKIIAVGDDDQCINNFGNDRADVRFINQFREDFEVLNEEKLSSHAQYSLLSNYRSKSNLVKFANAYNKNIPNRIKNNDLISHASDEGRITLVKYFRTDFIQNVIRCVQEDTSNNIAILLRNNDDVLNVYSQLVSKDINAKYITSKDGFTLGNLHELQFFLFSWRSRKSFELAYQEFFISFKESKNFYLSEQVIKKFELEYEGEIHKSEIHFSNVFEQYLKEIQFEEFESTRAKVIVSTMHKSKGKEFDSVYVCVEDNFIKNDYDNRLLYVALTRAKNNLYIHTKDKLFDQYINICSEVIGYDYNDPKPDTILFTMGLGDVSLSNSISQFGIRETKPISGEVVQIKEFNQNSFAIYKDGIQICLLSKVDATKPDRLSSRIVEYRLKGYELCEDSIVDYVVNWENDLGIIYLQVLCKISMKKVESCETNN